MLGRKGHAIALSKDHKPYEESTLFSLTFIDSLAEKARITAAGGFVDFGRVNGILRYVYLSHIQETWHYLGL